MKKILIILAPSGYQDKEYSDTRNALESAGIEVVVASLKIGEAKGFYSGTTKVDVNVDDVKVEDYDGVVFIGGQGMIKLVGESRFVDLAKKFFEAGKITAAICIAPMILANAGILKDKKATVWSGAKDDLEKGGCTYTGNSVEVDGKIITGQGPDAAKEFGKAIVDRFSSL